MHDNISPRSNHDIGTNQNRCYCTRSSILPMMARYDKRSWLEEMRSAVGLSARSSSKQLPQLKMSLPRFDICQPQKATTVRVMPSQETANTPVV